MSSLLLWLAQPIPPEDPGLRFVRFEPFLTKGGDIASLLAGAAYRRLAGSLTPFCGSEF